MANVTRSTPSMDITVSSQRQRGLTVWALRDFVAALDAEGIPDGAKVVDEHDHDTRHLVALRVHHVVTFEPPVPADTEGSTE